MASQRALWLVGVAVVVAVKAQTIAPSNTTYMTGLEIALGDRVDGMIQRTIPVAGLTSISLSYSPNTAIEGPTLLANASSQLSLAADDIALISCDPYQGIIQPSDVFTQAKERNVTAIILFSESAPSCGLSSSESGQQERVYTLTNVTDTRILLEAVTAMGATYAQVGPRQENGTPTSTNTASSATSTQNPSPLGPSPSTAVAMIILYSITGIITALFLIIIITGAVRAHRHPERYGPRNGIGRPRQSRARGLAMAMLETIPIVKFGDRTADQQAKATDVELGDASSARHEGGGGEERDNTDTDTNGTINEAARKTDGTNKSPKEVETTATPKATNAGEPSSSQEEESGIAAATDFPSSKLTDESSHLGCSICTEDFQLGEDQRLLPCDHRFHPACIDPWLLNVSGTCPLCRIDLRPKTSGADTAASDEASSVDTGGLAPPLERRSRRSIFGAFPRPERMTREERVRALRQLREGGGEAQQEERGLRERLRGAFRIRTRRTGDEEQQQQNQQRQNQQREGDASTTTTTTNGDAPT